MPTISPEALTNFSSALLEAVKVTPVEATRCAASLVDSNMRGYDSHGVMRIPFYVQMIEAGEIDLNSQIEIVKESPTSLVANANWGVGQSAGFWLADKLIQKAKQSGMAIGTMYRAGHIGRLGEYCELAAANGLVSQVMVNTHGAICRMAPPGGKSPRLGTNPLAFGVPHKETPLILDFSTSATAEGKVRVNKIAKKPCPEGWLVDCEGRPTTDPESLYAEPCGSILPFGGTQMYKGFGLGVMVDIFSGALSGGLCSREKAETQKGNCVFMMMINPENFGGADHFAAEVNQLVDFIRSCPTAEGVSQIMLPGDPERLAYKKRQQEGIFLDTENWAKLTELATSLGVSVPEVAA